MLQILCVFHNLISREISSSWIWKFHLSFAGVSFDMPKNCLFRLFCICHRQSQHDDDSRWAQENESSGNVTWHTFITSSWDLSILPVFKSYILNKWKSWSPKKSPMIPQFTLMIKCEASKASRKYFKLAIMSLHALLVEIIDRIDYK